MPWVLPGHLSLCLTQLGWCHIRGAHEQSPQTVRLWCLAMRWVWKLPRSIINLLQLPAELPGTSLCAPARGCCGVPGTASATQLTAASCCMARAAGTPLVCGNSPVCLSPGLVSSSLWTLCSTLKVSVARKSPRGLSSGSREGSLSCGKQQET